MDRAPWSGGESKCKNRGGDFVRGGQGEGGPCMPVGDEKGRGRGGNARARAGADAVVVERGGNGGADVRVQSAAQRHFFFPPDI
jgi:hypothetical protein